MTKQEFLQYLQEAVEAMDAHDLNQLFPNNKQPDLYSLLEALVGLRGEVKKIAQSSLLLQNEVQQVLETIKQQAITPPVVAGVPASIGEDPLIKTKDTQDLQYILRELTKLNPNMEKTVANLDELPDVKLLNVNEYKRQFSGWKEGFYLLNKQWKALVKSTGMYQTGKVNTLFNPEYHEAVATKFDAEKKENTILETVQIGYLYKGKVIQEAKVVVNKSK